MRIMIVTTPQELGGGETYIKGLIKGLPNHKFLVLTSLHEFKKQLDLEGIRSHLIITSIKFLNRLHILFFLILSPLNAIQYLYFLLIFNPDIVHIQSREEQILVTPIARLLGKKVIWTLHGPVERGNRVIDIMFSVASLLVSKIIAVSNFIKESAQSFGIKNPTVVIYHGIDLKNFRPMDVKNDQKIVGFVGRLVKVKRPEIFLRVSARILEKMTSVQAWIIGSGNLKAELERQISILPFKNRFKFLGFRKDMENVMRQLTVLLITSRTEGLDFSALEAIATGVPVIAVNVGALPEIINKETGFLIDSEDPEIIADKLSSVLQDKELLAKLKKSCRGVAEEKFSLDRMLVETDLVYTS